MSDPVELAQAISRTLGNLRFQEKDVKIFFGRVRSVEYPFMVVYFPLFTSSTADQNFYADIHAEIVIEFAYAAETDDLELYEFADSIIEPLKKGLQYKRREKAILLRRMMILNIGLLTVICKFHFPRITKLTLSIKLRTITLKKWEPWI